MENLKLVFLIVIAAPTALSQVTSGSLNGYVADAQGRAVADASIVVTDQKRTWNRSSSTDSRGFYQLLDLPPSSYRISASSEGFAEGIAEGVDLRVDSSARVDFVLQVDGLEQAIEVRARVTSLPKESAEIGVVFDQESIENLPLNRRDFLQLSLLAPGVAPPVEGSELSTNGTFAIHAGGGREEYNNFLLDGTDNNDPYVNGYVLQPSVDAIQEFKISISTYGAEYGRNAGGQLNVVTRSGSNQIHGSLYEYVRNRAFDARNFFDGADSLKYIRNQFGAGVGGPLRRNKTFYFANINFLRERRGLSRLGVVPSPALRSGDLSGLGAEIADPFTGQPFAGKVIPASRVDPRAQRVLDLFPLPNRGDPAANLLAQPVVSQDLSQLTTRIDHRLSEKDQLLGRLSFGRLDLFEPFGNETDAIPGFGDIVEDTGLNLAMQYQRIFNPAMVNSLTFGYTRFDREISLENFNTDVGSLWDVNWLPPGGGFPSVSVAGFSRIGDPTGLPILRDTSTSHIADSLSILRGQHSLKIGGEVRRVDLNSRLDLLTRGSITFSGALSGSGISDLLLGLPSFGLQSQADNPINFRTASYSGYLQDAWKLHPRLTVDLGVRYEYNTPPTDPADGLSTFDFASGGVIAVGTAGATRSGISSDMNNVAPRVGFAWSPGASWVVRSGYGVYHDAGMLVVNSAQFFNPPQFNLRVFLPSSQGLLSIADPFPTGGGFVPPASLNLLSRDLRTGYIQQWSLNVQRTLGQIGQLSLAYSGSKGTKLVRSRDPNQPRPGEGELQSRRPYPAFGSMFLAESGGNSSYNSLQAVFNRRLSGGIGFWAAYTYSKSMDEVSSFLETGTDQNFPQDSTRFFLERAPSSFDVRQRAAFSFIYSLPQENWLTRNADIRGIVTLQSAQPFTPILRFDNSNTGNSGGNFGSDRPDLIGDPKLSKPTPERWFDTAAFRVQQPFTFGSAGRNVVRGDSLSSVDLSIVRRFALTDRAAFQLEIQSFNLLNQTNFDSPEYFADEPTTFGRVFSAKAPRQIQLALRLEF